MSTFLKLDWRIC